MSSLNHWQTKRASIISKLLSKFNFTAKLTIAITVLIVVVVSIVGYISYRNSQDALFTSLKEQGIIMSRVIVTSSDNAAKAEKIAEEILERDMIAQVHLVNELLNSKEVTNQDLENIAAETGIGEFWITDEKGQTVLTNVEEGTGWVFPDDPNAQAYVFRELIGAPGKIVTQQATVRDLDGQLYKYVGVGRKDSPGIVQVGISAEKISEMNEQIGEAALIDSLAEQQSVEYAAIVDKEGKVEHSAHLQEHGIDLENNRNLSAALQGNKEVSDIIKHGDTEYVEVVISNGEKYYLLGLDSANVRSAAVESQANGQRILLAACLLLTIVGMIIVYTISKALTNPLYQLVDFSEKVAQGELFHTVAVKSKDEVGILTQSFNKMIAQIAGIIRQVSQSAHQVSDMSTQLMAAANQNTNSANETASSIYLVAEGAKTISEKIENVNENVEDASNLAEAGHKEINSIIEQMNTILSLSNETTKATKDLDQKAAAIGQILDIITNIADQTKLLGLNAAIEAARAGDQGHGFAVVAEEVRKLAEQSGNATKEIKDLVLDIQTVAHQTAESITAEAEEVQKGNTRVVEAGELFNKVTVDIEKLAKEFDYVAQEINQMSEGIQNIAAVTEEQSSTMEIVTTSVEDMDHLAKKLNEMVKVFKVDNKE